LTTINAVNGGSALPGRFTNRSGMTLTYRVIGSGPILVCHPGGPGFSSGYFKDLAGLDSVRRLVLFNPRGTADSDRPGSPRDYTIDDYVDDVEDLRQHLGLEAIDLLGHSHGGVIAQAYSAPPS
jgi:proline iminopeptidase